MRLGAAAREHDLSFDERLALLVEREVLHRENRRLARLLKAAKLRVNACRASSHPRGLEKARISSSRRTTCAWPHRLRQDQPACRQAAHSARPVRVRRRRSRQMDRILDDWGLQKITAGGRT